MRVPRWWVIGAAGVLLLSGLFRFWDLGGNPPGMFRDEVEKGYTALELWKTARHGEYVNGAFQVTRPLPFFLEVGGVETSAIYQYLSAPIVGLFGLNRWSTRFVAASAGWLTVLLGGLLSMVILGRGREGSLGVAEGRGRDAVLIGGLSAMAFVGLSPAHVLFSRWAQQGITVPLLVTAGVVLVLLMPGVQEVHRRAAAVCAGLLFALAFYAYAPARLVVPIFLLGLAWETRPDWRGRVKEYWPGAAVFLALSVPVFLYAATRGSARFERISVFAGVPVWEGVGRAAMNYARHFDPRFLFLYGDANPRHSLAHAGLMWVGEVPFFLAGLGGLLARRGRGARLLLIWLLAAPVASSLTTEGVPHALRSVLFLPVIHVVSALGVVFLCEIAGKRRVWGFLLVERVAWAFLLVHGLFVVLPRDGDPWQYGVLEALGVMDRQNPEGPNVLSGEVMYANYYVLFHERLEPSVYHEQGLDGARTRVLFPGEPLPEGALAARPVSPEVMFGGPVGLDIPSLGGDASAPPAMTIRREW